jgi:hypothetical protein
VLNITVHIVTELNSVHIVTELNSVHIVTELNGVQYMYTGNETETSDELLDTRKMDYMTQVDPYLLT